MPVPDDPPELSGLARSFNATAGRLEALLRSQQAFVADASHQLRTPLAALRLRLENLEAEGAHGEADDLERALTEVRRLSQLVDSLLLLARAEQAAPALVDLDLAALVEGRADAWFALAAERDVAIDADVPPIAVLGDAGPARAGPRQPPEQRARGRARRYRGPRRRPVATATASSSRCATRVPG